jgi:glucosyl-dolichyl phosphate glucuronosyltransferase
VDISVILCTYNRHKSLLEALESIKRSILPPEVSWEVIIVDNNSIDQTKTIAKIFVDKDPGRFRYIFEGRQGKSFALNSGVQAATGEILALADDDAIVDPNWLWELKRCFDEFDCLGVAGKILPIWSKEKPYWYVGEGFFKVNGPIVEYDLGHEYCKIEESHLPFGANLAFRKDVFKKYGLFRTDLGPNPGDLIRGEDTEFCIRLLDAGEKLVYSPKAIVHHPVEEERAQKRYFLSWYYALGKSFVRIKGISPPAIYYFGVPRWLLRVFFQRIIRYTFCTNPRKRFYHKVYLYRIAGEIVETRHKYLNHPQM